MNRFNDDSPPDDQNLDPGDDAGDEGDDEEQSQETELDQLKREIAELRAQNQKVGRDFQSSVGRLHSLIERLQSGRGSTDALEAQVKTQIEAVNHTLEAILEDETTSPELRARARAIAKEAQSASELAALRAEVAAMKGGNKNDDAEDDTSGGRPVSPFEQGIVLAIQAAGHDPDDPIFDWSGEATRIFNAQGEQATLAYFRQKIGEATTAKAAAERRQSRKKAGESGGGSPPPEGTGARHLDPSLPKDERLRRMVEMGVLAQP